MNESQLKMFDVLPEVTNLDHLTREELIERVKIQAEVQVIMKKAMLSIYARLNLLNKSISRSKIS